ncbi:hypothetical protein [Pseudomonas nitroreducens]|uniref:hypothetical protein n=1 Tax=Pseudomonas TaxID=286 RepID=UPI002F354A02
MSNKFNVSFKLTSIPMTDHGKSFAIFPNIEAYEAPGITVTANPNVFGGEFSPEDAGSELEITLSLGRNKKEIRWPTLAKNLDQILEDLVDFSQSTREVKTTILLQLAGASSVTLVGRIPEPSSAETASPGTGDGDGDDNPPPSDNTLYEPNSAPLPSGSYKVRNPITLQRTTRPLTGDVALWLMIKMNADNLSWENYTAQLELLFGSDSGAGREMLESAQHLSRRRFLPFTDTDAYRALKVATEAFVVTWGGVVPDKRNIHSVAELIRKDATAIRLASERLGIDISQDALVETMASQYFGTSSPPTIPYLTRVVEGLRGTDAEPPVQAALDEAWNSPDRRENLFCGETCLWLAHLNQDYSAKLTRPPLIELIWSYWMEEMQLVQTMNAISRRFQNVSSGPRDPLAQFELDAVRPLNNVIWGWVQDEQHRLPIERRAAEYQHEYGFRLFGRAVPSTQAADVRSKFLAAFHTLLNQCVPFFRQTDDTTVVPDGFPLLNALREVHLILSEGAHNQFRDLPSTSRIEMMMQQWILARPEMREFLPRRAMIAYPEPWMHSVESMRKLQGWGDSNTYQFWQLATTGEQIVSSIRWGNWNAINDPNNAANWAMFFRPEIQTYIHSYRAVTGIDVSAEPVDVQVPGIHLLRRLHARQGMKVERQGMAP